jgi:hypothetical protein
MASNGIGERSGRESRLLILVVGVSLAVLFVLARFRFPASDVAVVTPSAAPLAGLAARASFDDMAGTLSDVLARVSGAVAVVELAPIPQAPPAEARGRRGAPPPTAPAPVPSRWTPALRVGSDMAIAYVPDGWKPVSGLDLDGPVELVAADVRTQTAIVRVPSTLSFPDGFAGALRGFVGRAYVAVVGASPGGLSVDPAFIGRIDAVSEATWPQPLLRVSGHADLRSGELVFGVNGRLIGLVTSSMDTTWIVPPETLEALVGQLTSKGSTQ